MDLSANDILLFLGVLMISLGIGRTVPWLIGRGAPARTPTHQAPRHPGPLQPTADAPLRTTAEEPLRPTAGAPLRATAEGPLRPTAGASLPPGEVAPPPADDVPARPGDDAPLRPSGAPRGVGVPDQPRPDEADTTGRHHVSDELLQAATYRLSPDRRARATVPEIAVDRQRTSTPEAADLALNVLRRSRPGQPA